MQLACLRPIQQHHLCDIKAPAARSVRGQQSRPPWFRVEQPPIVSVPPPSPPYSGQVLDSTLGVVARGSWACPGCVFGKRCRDSPFAPPYCLDRFRPVCLVENLFQDRYQQCPEIKRRNPNLTRTFPSGNRQVPGRLDTDLLASILCGSIDPSTRELCSTFMQPQYHPRDRSQKPPEHCARISLRCHHETVPRSQRPVSWPLSVRIYIEPDVRPCGQS